MAYSVVINYGAGDINLTNYSGVNLVRDASFSKTHAIYNKERKAVVDTATFEIDLVTALASALLTLSFDQDITCIITKDGSAWFKGFIRPVTDVQVNTADNLIHFEAVDNTYQLKKRLTTSLQKLPADNMVVCAAAGGATSLVHAILSAAGFSGTVHGVDIPASISHFRADAGESGKDVFEYLDELLFSYHHTFYADAAGDIRFYDWSPSSISESGTFDADIIDSLAVNRDDAQETAVSVDWYKVETEEDVKVVSGPNEFSSYVPPEGESLWPPDTASPGDHLEKWWHWEAGDNEKKTAIGVEHVGYRYFIEFLVAYLGGDPVRVPYKKWTTGTINVTAYNYLHVTSYAADNALLKSEFYGQIRGLQITEVEITAHVTYKKKQAAIVYPSVGANKIKKYDGANIYSLEAAKDFAEAAYNMLSVGALRYQFKSLVSADIGSYWGLDNSVLNISTQVRIVKKSIAQVRGTEIYTYEAEGASAVSGLTLSPSGGNYVAPPGAAAIAAAVAAANAGLLPSGSVGLPIEGASLPESFDPQRTGIVLTNEKLGYYEWDNLTETGLWKAFIANDGTFLFKGDDSNYIEWDGADLTIRGNLLVKGTISAGDDLRSENYVEGVSGWIIDGDGNAEFNDVLIRGFLTTKVYVEDTIFKVTDPDYELSTRTEMKSTGFFADAFVDGEWVNYAALEVLFPPADGLYCWLGFEDDVSDYSESGNDATAYGSPTFMTGSYKKAINFNGSTQHVEIPSFLNGIISNANPEASISLRFSADTLPSFGNNAQILMKQGPVAGAFDLYLNGTGGLILASHGQSITLEASPSAGTWYRVRIEWDGIDIRGYLNNVLKGTITPVTVYDPTDYPVAIGAYNVNNGTIGDYFDGKIDEFRVYDRILTETENELVDTYSTFSRLIVQEINVDGAITAESFLTPAISSEDVLHVLASASTLTFIGNSSYPRAWYASCHDVVGLSKTEFAALTATGSETGSANYYFLSRYSVNRETLVSTIMGSVLTVVSLGSGNPGYYPSIDAFDDTDVVVATPYTDYIRVYRWNGSVWAMYGASLTNTSGGVTTVCAVKSDGTNLWYAFIDGVNDTLKMVQNDGTNATIKGTIAVSGNVLGALARIDDSHVLLYTTHNKTLTIYEYNYETDAWSAVWNDAAANITETLTVQLKLGWVDEETLSLQSAATTIAPIFLRHIPGENGGSVERLTVYRQALLTATANNTDMTCYLPGDGPLIRINVVVADLITGPYAQAQYIGIDKIRRVERTNFPVTV